MHYSTIAHPLAVGHFSRMPTYGMLQPQSQRKEKGNDPATSGYADNKELLRKHCAFYSDEIQIKGLPNTGDGIVMATEVGAATEGLGLLHLAGQGVAGSRVLSCTAEQPNVVWINKKGERFTDESTAFDHFQSVNALIRQPGKVAYSLLDEKMKKGYIETGVLKGTGTRISPLTKLPQLETQIKEYTHKGVVKISDSWSEIARWIGAPPKVLKATVREYNAFCRQGYDSIFNKDREYLEPLRTPPYYAIKCYPICIGTFGGIKINERMEVLVERARPIPGQYGAGFDTGGW